MSDKPRTDIITGHELPERPPGKRGPQRQYIGPETSEVALRLRQLQTLLDKVYEKYGPWEEKNIRMFRAELRATENHPSLSLTRKKRSK